MQDTVMSITQKSKSSIAQNIKWQGIEKNCVYTIYSEMPNDSNAYLIACTSNGRAIAYYKRFDGLSMSLYTKYDAPVKIEYSDTIVNNRKSLLCLVRQKGGVIVDRNILRKESDSSIIIDRYYLDYTFNNPLHRHISIYLNRPVDIILGKDFSNVSYGFFRYVSDWEPPKAVEEDFDWRGSTIEDYRQSNHCLDKYKVLEIDSIYSDAQYHSYTYDKAGNLLKHTIAWSEEQNNKHTYVFIENKVVENDKMIVYKTNNFISHYGAVSKADYHFKNNLYDSSISKIAPGRYSLTGETNTQVTKRTKDKSTGHIHKVAEYKIEITEARANEIMAKNPEKWPTQ